MEAKTPKALDTVALNLEQIRFVEYENKLTNTGLHIGRSLVRCFSNYKKSGRPERLLFYKKGEWLDFPKDVVDLVNNDLEVKKAAVEVEMNGNRLVLDFLHMYQLDMKTGLQQPIAWIDEAGCCFFPEVYSAVDEPNDIKLHLDIDLYGVHEARLRECSEESNTLVNHIQFDTKKDGRQYDVEVEDINSNKDGGNVGEPVVQNQEIGLDAYTEFVYGKLDLDSVQEMFLTGMTSFGIPDSDIVEIYRCSGGSMQARLELFQKQAEITNKFHGDANVRYAWLASSKGELSTMMEYGLGHCGLSSASKYTYGIGVHLAAVTCPDASVRYCDVDENGVRYLVLCRVIMGSMELLRPGTRQCHPSSCEYDNGVDDVQCPRCYIVWNMNVNTHIYPEFVVSFKGSLDAEGLFRGSESKNDVCGVNLAIPGPSVQLHADSSAVDTGRAADMVASTRRVAKSPWMSFPVLLAAIKPEVPPKDMYLLKAHYKQFKSKKISREDLVMKLRLIAGDNILKLALTSPQSWRTSFPVLLAAIKPQVPAKDMKLLKAHYKQFRSMKISRDDFVRKLRSIAGENILRLALTRLLSMGIEKYQNQKEG